MACYSCRAKTSGQSIYCKKCMALPLRTGGRLINETITRRNWQKSEVAKGVRGRDLIQPFDEKGLPNPEFIEHYGITNYQPEQKTFIREKMGHDPHREKDWRATQA